MGPPWDLGQPPREYQPATSLGPSLTDRKTKNFKKITTSKTRVKSPMQGYPSTKIPTYSKKNAQALLTLNNYCHNLPLILTLNPKKWLTYLHRYCSIMFLKLGIAEP